MESVSVRAPVLVAFGCPACHAPQGVDLMLLVREGTAKCGSCGRKLSHTQVSRAIERARHPGAAPEPTRRGLWA